MLPDTTQANSTNNNNDNNNNNKNEDDSNDENEKRRRGQPENQRKKRNPRTGPTHTHTAPPRHGRRPAPPTYPLLPTYALRSKVCLGYVRCIPRARGVDWVGPARCCFGLWIWFACCIMFSVAGVLHMVFHSPDAHVLNAIPTIRQLAAIRFVCKRKAFPLVWVVFLKFHHMFAGFALPVSPQCVCCKQSALAPSPSVPPQFCIVSFDVRIRVCYYIRD